MSITRSEGRSGLTCRRKGIQNGFTLIEILIVVAVIAILAAIAVPNFLEAQTRAKIVRVRADHRAIATAIEAYAVDYGRGPIGAREINVWSYGAKWGFGGPAADWWPVSLGRQWGQITTPVAYMSAPPLDPFVAHAMALDVVRSSPRLPADILDYLDLQMTRTYLYGWYDFQTPAGKWIPVVAPTARNTTSFSTIVGNGHYWSVSSYGPQRSAHQTSPNLIQTLAGKVALEDDGFDSIDGYYDPTNGTVSKGIIVRTSAGQISGE